MTAIAWHRPGIQGSYKVVSLFECRFGYHFKDL